MANYEIPGSTEVARQLAERRYMDFRRFEAYQAEQSARRDRVAPDLGGAAVVGAAYQPEGVVSREAFQASREVTRSTLADLASGFAEGVPAAFGVTVQTEQDNKLSYEESVRAADAAAARESLAAIYAGSGQPVSRSQFEPIA